MNRRPMTRRWGVGVAVLLFTLGLSACHRAKLTPFPAFHRYDALPTPFNQALQRLHEQHDARPNDFEIIRKLAYLYQANRLYKEAKTCYALLASHSPGLTARDHYYLSGLVHVPFGLGQV